MAWYWLGLVQRGDDPDVEDDLDLADAVDPIEAVVEDPVNHGEAGTGQNCQNCASLQPKKIYRNGTVVFVVQNSSIVRHTNMICQSFLLIA